MSYKKAFSMLMTLLVIIVFSLIVVLGLKISSLQIENERHYIPAIALKDKQKNILELFKRIFKSEILKCPKNLNIEYDTRYKIHSNIIYSPPCYKESIGNTTTQIIANVKLIDKLNDLSSNERLHLSHK